MEMMIFWLILTIALILIDVFTSAFLFVWFALGSLTSLILEIIGYDLKVQIIVFCIVSLIACAIGYPWAKKKFKNIKRIELMEEKYIGREIKASEDIIKKVQLKVDGIYWTGYNEGEKILKGETFIIKKIEGNKLIIRKKEEES